MKRNKQATRKKLINAFWELYCEKDIGKITVSAITSKTGNYRSTFYSHFIDVYDVLEQLENEIIDNILTNLPEDISAPLGDEFILNISKMYELNGEYISFLLGENGDPRFFKKLKNHLKPFALKQYGDDVDIEIKNLVFEFSISGIIYTVKNWYDNGKQINSEELLSVLRKMLTNSPYQTLKGGF